MVTFIEVGNALAEIRDRRLYKDQGFSSFEDYCQERWGWSRVRAHQYIGAAEVAGLLTNVNTPKNEAQARELVGLTPEQVEEVAERVDFKNATAADVKAAVAEVRADELTPEEETEVARRVRETPPPPPREPSANITR